MFIDEPKVEDLDEVHQNAQSDKIPELSEKEGMKIVSFKLTIYSIST